MFKRNIIQSFVISLIMSVSFLACASTPEAKDPDFLGDYPAQDLGSYMMNTIPQGKDELTARDVSIIFYPATNVVEIKFRYAMDNIDLFFYKEDRTVALDSMKQYLSEYKAGQLTAKNNKKRAYFGSTKMDMMWGLLGTGYYAKPTLRFEYQFIGSDKPYFVMANMTSPRTTQEGKEIKDGGGCPAVRLAISPIQAQKLMEILSQEYLQSLVDELKTESQEFDLPADEGAPAPAYDPEAAF